MFGYQKAPDLEAGLGGSTALYPGMTESPDLRWGFVRKIYVILAVQLAMTAAVSAFVVKVPAVSQFFVSSNAGIALYIFLIILPFLGQLRLSPFLLPLPQILIFASYFRIQFAC
jgi:protein lifeguard